MRSNTLCATVAVILSLVATLEPSHAIFGIFSKDEDKDRMPTKSEVAHHDLKAAKLFAVGEKAQNDGNGKKALKSYNTITRKYYFSQYAAEATFRVAEILKGNGEALDAFDYYQSLVDRYRSSPRFQRALEQQYNIAIESLTGKDGKFLGVLPRKTSRDRVIKMFETVISNALASVYAANSQYYIARTHEGRKDYDEAITAYQKVVDEYPRSQKAPQAQLKIGEIYERTAKRPDNPSNLKESREAYEDFITNFPQHRESGGAFAQLNAISEKEAKKSLKHAKYYKKKGNMKAAAIYYKDVLRSSNAALKLEARQGIEAVRKVDPQALEVAKIDGSELEAPAYERLKNQENYLGPPAPDLVSNTRKKPAAPTRTPSRSSSRSKPTPAPLPEPALPTGAPGAQPFDVGVLAPAPPPPSEDDVLGVGGPVIDDETDIDSLLPPVPDPNS